MLGQFHHRRHYVIVITTILVVSAIIGVSADYAAACSCGSCSLNTDWDNHQFSSTTGLKIDLRYDYLNQSQLRHSSHAISPYDASWLTNNDNPQEVERYTRSSIFTLGIDYAFNSDWGINVQIPYIYRKHSTLGTASDGETPGDGGGQYDSRTTSIGDIKVIGRFQGFLEERNLGILFGVKIPTGRYTMTGTSTDSTAPGPVTIDRGLQPGTGTTDTILGIYYTNNISHSLDYFAQAMIQMAMNSKRYFKPGMDINLSAGLRYTGLQYVHPQVQLNYRYTAHDIGDNADTFSTGSTVLYVSPGLSVPIGQHISTYGFMQLPLYQYYRGVQLAPRYTMSFGVRYAF